MNKEGYFFRLYTLSTSRAYLIIFTRPMNYLRNRDAFFYADSHIVSSYLLSKKQNAIPRTKQPSTLLSKEHLKFKKFSKVFSNMHPLTFK